MQKDSRIIAAILAADVVEYSRLMAADEPGTLAALKSLRATFAGQVAEFGGREFGSVGDSLMAEFPSAVNAVSAALAIQDAVAAANAALPPARRMLLRAGVNLGDVIEEKGGFFGDAVNVAARLQALAKPGGVLISGAVYDQVHAKLEARYVDAGTRQVKNIREPVRSFEVLPPAPPGIGGRIAAAFTGLFSRRILRGALVGVAVGIALGLGLFWRDIPVPATGGNLGAILEPDSTIEGSRTLAVLPFANMTGDAEYDYLGDGMAEELHQKLSRVPGLTVAARRSAFVYKDKSVDVRQIAQALGVNYVVEGTVRRQGGRVRVSASLVERGTGTNVWSNSYESVGDFFSIEDDIGTQVLTALKLVLEARPASAATAGSRDATAYDHYLRGLSHLRKPRSSVNVDAAERWFSQALEEQPDFARAQAGLCRALVERYALDREPAHVTAAESACSRARALDGSAQEVHEALGQLLLATGNPVEAEAAYRKALKLVPASPDLLIGLAETLAAGGKAPEAESTLRRAIAVQPSYAAAHTAYGNFLVAHGRAREAAAAHERATELAPDNPNAFSNLGGAYLYLGEFEKADEAFSRSLAIEPRRGSYSNVGTALYYRGQFAKAAEMFRKAIDLAPSDHRLWGNLADALLFGGLEEEAGPAYRRALELAEGELGVNPRHATNRAQAAYYSTRLGESDRARNHIAIALKEGDRTDSVHYYVALAELGLGDRRTAVAHARRAKELGYPESFLKAAPELAEVRTEI
jgi:class 3 adenylate cyclase/TolB-like protein/Tfp pilus assembly protein PilF